ncbi:DUF7178 family protein [Bradyrhizobium sp. 1(2017)]|uniref:DUF7178 family protein n=1 Tax=Bradyrhizobium sp. 1(2017) TaxID=1404888 RepID=UPI00140EA723|nr:hypothetical protein [Bradyrhizobium sp. 1(2017)]QIO34332.1 hypothetical protein HAP40_22310 [Bradyrhizobium sp. 1(2017)]
MADGYGPLDHLRYRRGVSEPLSNLSQDAAETAAARVRRSVKSEARRASALEGGADAASMAAGLVPGAGIADVLGLLPDFGGGYQPSFGRNLMSGNYRDAALQTFGLGGDMMLATPLAALGMAAKGAREASRLPIAAGDTRVSTRFPTAVKATEDPLREHLSIGLNEMKADPETFAHNTSILSRAPGFRRLAEMAPDEAADAYINQAKGNMQFLYENSPEVMKTRAPLWYEGANRISDALASRWGIPRQSASAALAALSPQKDWFMNATLGERVGDIVMNNPRATSDMEAWIRSQPKVMAADNAEEMLRRISGQRLDQLNPKDAALFVRAFDEAHNTRNYRSILPEGDFGDWFTTQSGDPSKVAWGTFGDIGKAVSAIQSGGDMDTISRLLGEKHKVRSFYNNIEVPNDPRFGDVTADTHQVAAAQLRPLSGASEAVIQHLASGGPAGSVNSRSSAITGVKGTYGLVNDATRQFAEDAGLLGRAGQSATWEPVRELFPAKWKTAKNNAAVDDIWGAYDRGEIPIEQARKAIFDLAGGIGTPEWARSGIGASSPYQGSTYR